MVMDRACSVGHEWFQSWPLVVALGRWLVTQHDYTGAQLQAYYEKPWKWDNEYHEFDAERGRKAGRKDF